MQKLVLFAVIFLSSLTAAAAGKVAIVPQPVELKEMPGEFTLTPKTTISCDAALKEYAEYLRDAVAGATGFDLNIVGKKGVISLAVDSAAVGKAEGYRLTVTP